MLPGPHHNVPSQLAVINLSGSILYRTYAYPIHAYCALYMHIIEHVHLHIYIYIIICIYILNVYTSGFPNVSKSNICFVILCMLSPRPLQHSSLCERWSRGTALHLRMWAYMIITYVCIHALIIILQLMWPHLFPQPRWRCETKPSWRLGHLPTATGPSNFPYMPRFSTVRSKCTCVCLQKAPHHAQPCFCTCSRTRAQLGPHLYVQDAAHVMSTYKIMRALYDT